MKPFIITLLCALSFAASAQQYTLEECVNIALQNNRSIKQQELNKQGKTNAYNQARADLLPSLNASAGQNFTFGRSIGIDNTYQNTNSSQASFGVSADITLFDGLRMKHNIDARRADLHASQADMQKMQEDIEMSVSTAFLQVLLNKELLLVADNQLELTKENVKRRAELVQSGKMAQGELYELESQQAKEELSQIQSQNNLKLALLDLAQIMELEDFGSLDVIAPDSNSLTGNAELLLLSPEATFKSALLNRPEVRRDTYRLESSEKEVLMAKAQYYPSLSFGASMGTGYYRMNQRENLSFSEQVRNNMSNSLAFNLRIPIFNKFQMRNSVRNAQIAVKNIKLEIDKNKLELRKKVEQAYYNALAAQSRWKAAQKSETASREAFRFAQQKYENGRANAYELFQAKNNLTQVLAEQVQAKYEYVFRLKILKLLRN